jgi:hypothetical protein
MRIICRTPLQEFLRGQQVTGYYDQALAWVERLQINNHPRSSYSDLIPLMVWELRQFLPESVAVQFLLEVSPRSAPKLTPPPRRPLSKNSSTPRW